MRLMDVDGHVGQCSGMLGSITCVSMLELHALWLMNELWLWLTSGPSWVVFTQELDPRNMVRMSADITVKGEQDDLAQKCIFV